MSARPAAATAEDSVEVVVEIDRRAGALVEPTLTRRLVAIELVDLEMPPAPGDATPAADRSLFVRVIGQEDAIVRVELWELGRRLGAREVALGPTTAGQLRSRRIALVAAALGREAAFTRRLELRHAAEQARLDEEARRAAAEVPPDVRVALSSGLRAGIVGSHGLRFVGPRLEAGARLADGATLAVGAGAFAGAAPFLDESSTVEWFEVSLTPGWGQSLADRGRWAVGLDVAAASVQLPRATAVDAVVGQTTTYSARAGSRVDLELGVGSKGALLLGAGVGMVLRPVPAANPSGASDLRGAWMSLDVGWVLDPHRGAKPARRSDRGDARAGTGTGSPSAPQRGSATGS